MKNRSLTSAAAASLALVVLGFSLGWFSHDLHSAGDPSGDGAAESQPRVVSPEPRSVVGDLPGADVPGHDLQSLSRYPGSVRTKHEQKTDGDLSVTEVDYLVEAEPDSVREFYRGVFDAEGWTVADVRFSRGDWEFLVLSGEREVVIEVEPLNGPEEGLVEIELELSEPRSPG